MIHSLFHLIVYIINVHMSDHSYIFQSVLRLFFDLLHGIKRVDVPLIMVVEFLVFLGYDGQLKSNSDMEKELFKSAINQLKERYNILINFVR